MSTHGVFVLKIDEDIFGFHLCANGYNVASFFQEAKELDDLQIILKAAFDYFADSEYTDCPNTNIYKEKYNLAKNYTDITEYTCYFDGKNWFTNWGADE
jgi:hypothetical protein